MGKVAIVLAFTLKGQDFAAIAAGVKKVKADISPNTVVIHGFMPRADVIAKGFGTEVVDLLEESFPLRLNMYNGGRPLREEMANIADSLQADVYVIGEIKEGVAEEVELYKSVGLNIKQADLN